MAFYYRFSIIFLFLTFSKFLHTNYQKIITFYWNMLYKLACSKVWRKFPISIAGKGKGKGKGKAVP
jgi:hypothetical protein